MIIIGRKYISCVILSVEWRIWNGILLLFTLSLLEMLVYLYCLKRDYQWNPYPIIHTYWFQIPISIFSNNSAASHLISFIWKDRWDCHCFFYSRQDQDSYENWKYWMASAVTDLPFRNISTIYPEPKKKRLSSSFSYVIWGWRRYFFYIPSNIDNIIRIIYLVHNIRIRLDRNQFTV